MAPLRGHQWLHCAAFDNPLISLTGSPYSYVAGNPLNATDATGLVSDGGEELGSFGTASVSDGCGERAILVEDGMPPSRNRAQPAPEAGSGEPSESVPGVDEPDSRGFRIFVDGKWQDFPPDQPQTGSSIGPPPPRPIPDPDIPKGRGIWIWTLINLIKNYLKGHP